MRKMDIFCASPASTAICSAMDQRSMVRRGHTPLDRHHNYDLLRPKGQLARSAAKHHTRDSHRSISADAHDLARKISRRSHGDSTRFLLSDNDTNHGRHLIERLSDPNHSSAATNLVSVGRRRSAKEPSHVLLSENYDSPKLVKSCSSRSCHEQVVVLRVSLHCKGCEGKVRKHISKMEGVTSFTIEFESKKVTVIGSVTPSEVLASLSRVKNAQLWPSPKASSSSSFSSSSITTKMPSFSTQSSYPTIDCLKFE